MEVIFCHTIIKFKLISFKDEKKKIKKSKNKLECNLNEKQIWIFDIIYIIDNQMNLDSEELD